MDADLKEHLLDLHRELGQAPNADPETRQLLGEILKDVHRLLEQRPPPTTAAQAPGVPVGSAEAGLPERLEKVAIDFEVDHPTLAASSRRLIDLLGKVGL